jgi:hypothetical protein
MLNVIAKQYYDEISKLFRIKINTFQITITNNELTDRKTNQIEFSVDNGYVLLESMNKLSKMLQTDEIIASSEHFQDSPKAKFPDGEDYMKIICYNCCFPGEIDENNS